MSQVCEGRRKAFPVAGAIGRALRVKCNGTIVNGVSQIALCGNGATDTDIGTTENQTFNANDIASVVLRSATGTQLMTASGAIAVQALVYGDVNGQISSNASGDPLGIALQAAANAGDIIEVVRLGKG